MAPPRDPNDPHAMLDDVFAELQGRLVWFGLLDSRELPRQERWERPIQLRKTPLYDRLLRFDFSAR